MSRKFKVPLGLVALGANPAVGSVGDMYYNTNDKLPYTFDGTTWQSSVNVLNIDGGIPDSQYGGLSAIDCGGVS